MNLGYVTEIQSRFTNCSTCYPVGGVKQATHFLVHTNKVCFTTDTVIQQNLHEFYVGKWIVFITKKCKQKFRTFVYNCFL